MSTSLTFEGELLPWYSAIEALTISVGAALGPPRTDSLWDWFTSKAVSFRILCAVVGLADKTFSNRAGIGISGLHHIDTESAVDGCSPNCTVLGE